MEMMPIQSGACVRFALSRVVCPDVDEVWRQIDSNLEVEGRIVFLSDYGRLKQHFAIVQVKGIHVPLIVPIEYLRIGEGMEGQQSGLVNKSKAIG